MVYGQVITNVLKKTGRKVIASGVCCCLWPCRLVLPTIRTCQFLMKPVQVSTINELGKPSTR